MCAAHDLNFRFQYIKIFYPLLRMVYLGDELFLVVCVHLWLTYVVNASHRAVTQSAVGL